MGAKTLTSGFNMQRQSLQNWSETLGVQKVVYIFVLFFFEDFSLFLETVPIGGVSRHKYQLTATGRLRHRARTPYHGYSSITMT